MTQGCLVRVVLWGALVISLISAVVAAVRICRAHNLGKQMGLHGWTFTSSWASNLTVVSGLISFTLAMTVLSNDGFLSKNQYIALSLAFPFITALAPLVYNLTGRPQVVDLPGGVKGIGVTGWAITFITAALLTLWGATGQLVVQALVFFEICRIAELGSGAKWLEIVAFALATVGLLVYGQRTIVMSVAAQPGDHPDQTRWALL